MTETFGPTTETAPLRILHIVAAEETPGEADQALALMERLAMLGHTQSLLAAPGSALEAEARSRGLEVAPLALPSIAQLSRGLDLVHAHDSRAHSMAVATARAPVIVSRRIGKPVLRSPAARWKYRRAAHFIAISHYVEQMLLNAAIPPERISVVYEGVDVSDHAPGADSRLAIALDGDARAIVEQAAQLAGVPVEFVRDGAMDALCGRVFLYLTRRGASILPVLRAMACGVPVIASRVEGPAEIVEDDQTGFLVSNDAQEVANAICQALDRPELGAHARARVAERFTLDRMAGDTLEAYRRTLAPPQPESSSS
jgi:hypothetical protein